MGAIVTPSEFREHTVSDSGVDDVLVAGYIDSAESWVLSYLNLKHSDIVGIDPQKFSIIRQAVLLLGGQFFLQREEVGPQFHRRSHLTTERLLKTIRARQTATLTDTQQ